MPDQSRAYEMMMIEGQPYFQLVEENGSSLSAKQLEKEEAKMRKAADARRREKLEGKRVSIQSGRKEYPYHRLSEFHTASFANEHGRVSNVAVIETLPRANLRENGEEEKVLLNSTTKLWIDTRNMRPIKGVVRLTERTGKWPKGMVLIAESRELDDGWMPSRLVSYRPLIGMSAALARCAGVEVEQVLSKFRKFASESTFRFGDVVPEP